MKPYYRVFAVNGGPPTRKHDTLEEAQAEAERLAAKHPGWTFEILQCQGIAMTVNVRTFWMDGLYPEVTK